MVLHVHPSIYLYILDILIGVQLVGKVFSDFFLGSHLACCTLARPDMVSVCCVCAMCPRSVCTSCGGYTVWCGIYGSWKVIFSTSKRARGREEEEGEEAYGLTSAFSCTQEHECSILYFGVTGR